MGGKEESAVARIFIHDRVANFGRNRGFWKVFVECIEIHVLNSKSQQFSSKEPRCSSGLDFFAILKKNMNFQSNFHNLS